jgi:hypothetical protein
MLEETQYRHPLQDWTTKLATRIWQTVLDSELILTEHEPKAPQVIFLGFLINGYARNPGHYVPDSNLIVINQRHKTLGMNERATITHELAHWLQHRLEAYRPTRDTHTHVSWSMACHHITQVLTESEWDLQYFKPMKSTRIDGKPVRRQREGALTLKELHHWPDSIPSLLNLIEQI